MKLFHPLIVILSLMLFSGASAKAQTHYNSNIAIGIKAGADLSRMFFNPGVKQDLKPGALAGFTFRYVEESHFGLVAELNFTQRGWKENFEGKPLSYSRTIDYLMLPVLAHIYFGRRGRFFVNIGPEIGLRISDKASSNFDIYNASNNSDMPKYHEIKQYTEPIKQRVDYGICAGLGGEFSVTQRHALYGEVRFYYGLGNLFSSNRRDYFNASNSMNLEFTLGYWLRIH
ncbi:MAG: PorT family protein [Muribaculaceae bacterium]|nr:PorT family protein [Muribaculaceae bacterium]